MYAKGFTTASDTLTAMGSGQTALRIRQQMKQVIKHQAVVANRVLSRAGILVTPRHYYSSAPDLRGLAASRELWRAPSRLPGLRIDLDEQIAWLEEACKPFLDEYRGGAVFEGAGRLGPGYGYVEAQALHGILRSLGPRRYLEVGSGVSTHIAVEALARNGRDGRPGTVTCVEPYPRAWLTSDPRVHLRRTPVQAVDLELFTSLTAGDVLFVDSSHVVKAGSDVNFLVLEVFPRLAPGVVVHVHDIYLPYDYQCDLLDSVLHWAETSLVRAFLTHNDHARILACMSHLHYERPDGLRVVFPDYRPAPHRDGLLAGDGHFPSSLWFEVC
ncbi:class I SAM-dependent methyltransferase [Streptomyces cyaneochromogenes]|uniref:Class I SAM-dependent methyltransferase n=1 Tax=Streptomyces cyaneochromogenes TaxID=2496836 RepID=A0A3Q9EV66_9ACTN|nr:class I SAM-dependent methyltransferase [Streptomyces cyaneochromogenes]AZQ36752.1 class I SAM-dependent methyltransferase [Streptomyces cyaneochromogenes]